MPGGKGMSDIYKVNINKDGTLGKPENLGDKINTEGKEKIDTDKKNNVELSSESVKEVINETKENYASGSPSPAANLVKRVLPVAVV